MNRYTLDARNIPCPRPLLKTKEALEKEAFEILEIELNNSAARENVCRFLKKSGMEGVEWQDRGNGSGLLRHADPRQTNHPPLRGAAPGLPPGSLRRPY